MSATTAFPVATSYVKLGFLHNYPTGSTDATAVARVSNVGLHLVGGGVKWLSGTGLPAAGLGMQGDWYINDANGDVYEKTTANVWTWRDNLTGPAGTAGTPGEKWFSGTGAPAGGTGIIGDWYLNDANGDVYEKTGASAWTLRDNLTGPQGVQGNPGTPGVVGSKWYSGTGAPAGGTGVVGDWYLNDTNGDVYEKTGASTWTLRDNLTGPTGTQGTQGNPGTAGTTGLSSDCWNFTYNSTTTTPGTVPSGQIRFDAVSYAGLVKMWVSNTSKDGTDTTILIRSLTIGDEVYLTSTPTSNSKYTVTGAPTAGADFSILTVLWVSGNGAMPSTGSTLTLCQRAKGTAGPAGPGLPEVYVGANEPIPRDNYLIWIDTDAVVT